MTQPIAIVGMGCRFGGAPDLNAYWKLMLEGRDAFREIPPDRWDHDFFHSTSKRVTDKYYPPRGAFVDDIRTFPALHFGIPPRRVEVMDPQHRIALEVSVQALADAGHTIEDAPRRTGVFLGTTAYEYRALMSSRVIAQMMATGALGDVPDDPGSIAASVERVVPSRPFSAPGALGNMTAATVAQELDLRGPAFTSDAACASALIAVTDAVAHLRQGSIDAALAGGVYVNILPEHYIAFSRIGAMSASGYLRPFDHRADGFLQGDGGGVVLLKRLDDALQNGDRIYAVIHGAAFNNDGRGDGPMAPLKRGQVDAIERAWDNAGVSRSKVGYIEAHGTGTQVGDQTEFSGLCDAFGDAPAQTVYLGSSKANIGHTMSAAGVAGLIRTALAIHHGVVPPMAGFEHAKDELPLGESVFDVPTRPMPWGAEERVAGISSFGFGGTNAHVVVGSLTSQPRSAEGLQLVQISGPDEATLRAHCGDLAQAIAEDDSITPARVARTLAVRPSLVCRATVVAGTREELLERLSGLAAGDNPAGTFLVDQVPAEAPKVAFLYPGQGAQRPDMLVDARARFGVIDETLRALSPAVDGLLVQPLTSLLYPSERAVPVSEEQAMAELTATQNCQPALLAVGVALTRLLDQVGVRPTVVLGHSLGEFTAAAVGGVLDADEAVRFVAQRGLAMDALAGDHGSMAAIMAPEDQVTPLLADGCVVANVNHPRQVVVSGPTEAVRQTAANAEAAEIRAVLLEVSHAFHSPVLGALDVDDLVDGLTVHEPGSVRVASGIAATPYGSASEAREVFRRHATSPVRFVRALEQCTEAGAQLFLQVGAGGPTAAFARGALPREWRSRVMSLAGVEDKDGGKSLLEGLARLWLAGVAVDVRPLTEGATVCTLPATPLPRELYWAVKDEPQLPLDLPGLDVRRKQRQAQAPAAPVAEAPKAEVLDSGDPIKDKVVSVISKVSAYPAASIRLEMTLVDDLGFDSLMVGDLATGLADAFPGMGGIPQELLVNRPTVGVLVDHVRSGSGGSSAAELDDDAPLSRYRPVWLAAPMPKLPRTSVAKGTRAIVTRDADGLCDAVARDLERAGAIVQVLSPAEALTAGPCELFVHCTAAGITTPFGHVLEGLSEWPDSAGELLALLANQARQEATPDVLVAIEEGDVWGEAMTGALLSLDREWPQARVKAVTLAEDAALDLRARALLSEWTSADTTVEVHIADGLRSVRGFVEVDEAHGDKALPIGAEDVVLISGGTRGIGVKLAARLQPTGAQLLLLGRSEPSAEARALLGERVHFVRADITDRTALALALAGYDQPTVFVHAAGILADGPLEEVEPARGLACRQVKVDGWLSGLAVCGDRLRIAVGLGSWAGRFGNRHQTHYGAANALLSAIAAKSSAGVAVTVAEMGPWASSEMVSTIPAAIQNAMRAEGVDFVGDDAGLDALLRDLGDEHGPLVHGRRVPASLRRLRYTETLSTATHPFLMDHAIQGVPVLPLASAADLLARLAPSEAGFALDELRLFTGITVSDPVTVEASLDGTKAELRLGDNRTLAYRATLVPLTDPTPAERVTGGDPPPPDALGRFYREVTFHGPLLQGIASVTGEGASFVTGQVRTCAPADWIVETSRQRWAIDPLALDSAFQLAGYMAERRFDRGGTPVGIDRWEQHLPWPEGELAVQVTDWEMDGDRFSGTVELFDASGALVARAIGAQADFKTLGDEPALVIKPEWVDPSTWKEVRDLDQRLEVAKAIGIQNPYFMVHEGTARNTTVIDGRELVNYSSYNYLGLSGDERVLDQVDEAVRAYGTSVSASRVASGERPFHHELEALLAECQRAEDALLFTAGHATNVTTIGHLMGPDDLILHDELIHDSALQGIKLSGSARRSFKHDDMADLERQLRQLRGNFQKCLIIAEGVYSMDGDLCQLPALVALKKRHGCLLMVDEAHSFGICGPTGCGVGEHYDVAPGDVDIWMGTLSKSLASCGGWIAGSAPLIRYLRYTAPGFVYSAGLTPANGVAALASLRLMLEEPERVQQLQSNARFFHDECTKRGLDTGPALGGSAVIPVVTGNSMHALVLSQRLMEQGINVQPIIYPAVADDASRLRFFLSSTHTEAQLRWTAERVAETLATVRAEYKL